MIFQNINKILLWYILGGLCSQHPLLSFQVTYMIFFIKSHKLKLANRKFTVRGINYSNLWSQGTDLRRLQETDALSLSG